jgi:hypothetical protein
MRSENYLKKVDLEKNDKRFFNKERTRSAPLKLINGEYSPDPINTKQEDQF